VIVSVYTLKLSVCVKGILGKVLYLRTLLVVSLTVFANILRQATHSC
jgi:hypothetical protein